MQKRLTTKFIETLSPPPGKKRVDVYDTLVQGFHVRATQKGRKTFAIKYRQSGRQRRKTIGQFPLYNLADAREAARQILINNQPGRTTQPAEITFNEVLDEYIEKYAVRRQHSWDRLRELRKGERLVHRHR